MGPSGRFKRVVSGIADAFLFLKRLNMSEDGHFNIKSQREIARFFRQQPRTIERWRAEGMPGKPRCYDLQAILFWALEAGKLSKGGPEDSLLIGEADSEGLERFRLAHAQREEIKLTEERGQVVLMSAFHESARAILSPLRKLQETLKRRQDHDTFSLVEEAIDEMDRGLSNVAGHEPEQE